MKISVGICTEKMTTEIYFPVNICIVFSVSCMYSVFKSILIISCLFLLFICLFECVGEWMNWVGYNKKFLFALWNHHGVGIHNGVKIFMKSHSNLCQNWFRQVQIPGPKPFGPDKKQISNTELDVSKTISTRPKQFCIYRRTRQK